MPLFGAKRQRPRAEPELAAANAEAEVVPVGPAAAPGPVERILGYQEEASLRDIVLTLLRGWWVVAIVTALVLAAAALWMKRQPVLYAATMVLGPPPTQESSPLQSNQGGLGTLTKTLGITADTSDNRLLQLLETLTTVRLAERLQARHGVLQQLYVSQWDAERQVWVRPERGWSLTDTIKELFGIPTWYPPSAASLAGHVNGRLTVTDIPRTEFHRVEFLNPDPDFAVTFLDTLFREADAYMREVARERNRRLAEAVNQKLQQSVVVEERNVLLALLSKQVFDSVMVEIGDSFAAEVIEPPRLLPVPVSPQPILVLTFAAMGGILLGIIAVFFVDLMRSPKARSRG